MSRSPSQRGSAIIMLFVAVALFGAVTYAFMRGSGNSVAMMSDEQAKAYAQQIIAYNNDVKSAVKRLQLRGCKDTEISFENNVITRLDGTLHYTAHDTVVADTCKIHHTKGGGIAPKVFTEATAITTSELDYPVNGSVFPQDSVFVGMGTGDIDLLMQTRRLRKEVCVIINDMLGVPNINGNPPIDNMGAGSTNKFFGNYNGAGIMGDGESATEIQAAKGGCVDNGGEHYNLRMLLIAR